MLLVLYGRNPLDAVALDGDRATAEAFLAALPTA